VTGRMPEWAGCEDFGGTDDPAVPFPAPPRPALCGACAEVTYTGGAWSAHSCGLPNPTGVSERQARASCVIGHGAEDSCFDCDPNGQPSAVSDALHIAVRRALAAFPGGLTEQGLEVLCHASPEEVGAALATVDARYAGGLWYAAAKRDEEARRRGAELLRAVFLAGAHPQDVGRTVLVDLNARVSTDLSAEEIGEYIACGNIGGTVHERENGEGMEITIALAELNEFKGESAGSGQKQNIFE